MKIVDAIKMIIPTIRFNLNAFGWGGNTERFSDFCVI